MDVYTELHCICRDLVKKAKYLDAYGAMERRRMIIQGSGTMQGEPRRECTRFRVKSKRKKQHNSGIKCGFESWKYGYTFLEKS